MIRWSKGLLAAALLLGSFQTPAEAATLRVPGEYPTIQAAIDAAVFGDTVLVAPGTYTHYEIRGTHTSCVFLKDGVALVSEEGPNTTTIDARNLMGPQPSTVEGAALSSPLTALEGFTIANTGPFSFGGLILFGRLTVRDCIFRDLDEPGSSGAGANVNGEVIFDGCEFENCHAEVGGAIYHSNGTIQMYGCEVRECGNIGIRLNENAGPPAESAWIEGCIFEDCADGGALSIAYIIAPVAIRDCVFRGNIDNHTGGGGLSIGGNGSRLVEGCLFLHNEATGGNGGGGAIAITGPATLRNNTFWGNAAYTDAGGSAIRFRDGNGFEFLNNVIAGGIGEGGAIEAQFGSVNSSCNIFWANEGGDGVHFTPGPTDREVDPLFCNPALEDFTVDSTSPCLPENSLGCGLIGAFGEGCTAVSVPGEYESKSWGAIKGLYR